MYETKETLYVPTDELVNLSGGLLTIYDDSTGEILQFPCFEAHLTFKKALKRYETAMQASSGMRLFYVFRAEHLEALEASGVDLSRVALQSEPSTGRQGVAIAHLHWAVQPEKSIVVRGYHGDNGISRPEIILS